VVSAFFAQINVRRRRQIVAARTFQPWDHQLVWPTLFAWIRLFSTDDTYVEMIW
jgi:hypothetical protein